jgi:hypothetical protein
MLYQPRTIDLANDSRCSRAKEGEMSMPACGSRLCGTRVAKRMIDIQISIGSPILPSIVAARAIRIVDYDGLVVGAGERATMGAFEQARDPSLRDNRSSRISSGRDTASRACHYHRILGSLGQNRPATLSTTVSSSYEDCQSLSASTLSRFVETGERPLLASRT